MLRLDGDIGALAVADVVLVRFFAHEEAEGFELFAPEGGDSSTSMRVTRKLVQTGEQP